MVCLPLAIQTDVLAAVYLRAVDMRGEGRWKARKPRKGASGLSAVVGILVSPRPLSSQIDSPQRHRHEYVGLNG